MGSALAAGFRLNACNGLDVRRGTDDDIVQPHLFEQPGQARPGRDLEMPRIVVATPVPPEQTVLPRRDGG